MTKTKVSYFYPDTTLSNTVVVDSLRSAIAATDTLAKPVTTSTYKRDSATATRKKITADLLTTSAPADSVTSALVNIDTLVKKNVALAKTPVKKAVMVESIFKDSPIQNSKLALQVRHPTAHTWLLSVILLTLFIIGLLNVLFNKKIAQLLKAFFNPRFATQVLREENARLRRVSFFLSLAFIIIIGLFTFFSAQVLHLPAFYHSAPLNFFIITLCVAGFYLFKLMSFWSTGFIFNTVKESNEYLFDMVLFNQMLGFALMPLVVCLTYVKSIEPQYLIGAGLAILFGFFVVRMVRTYINLGINARVSKLYLFLYLCTLEILPIAFVVKLILRKL